MTHYPLACAAIAALALAASLVLAPSPARSEEDSLVYEGLVGMGAALCTLAYGPVKVAYATTGLLISGLAWLWTMGDTDVAEPIYTSSIGGDYVVTPSHLEGRQSLEFVGR